MANKEKFYVFDLCFREGNWKTWGIGAILLATFMTSMPKLESMVLSHDDKKSVEINIPCGERYSNVARNRVDVVYFDKSTRRAY